MIRLYSKHERTFFLPHFHSSKEAELPHVAKCFHRERHRVLKCTLFFYKNIFYKNIEAEICEILRIF